MKAPPPTGRHDLKAQPPTGRHDLKAQPPREVQSESTADNREGAKQNISKKEKLLLSDASGMGDSDNKKQAKRHSTHSRVRFKP